jgi:hypothetical protein
MFVPVGIRAIYVLPGATRRGVSPSASKRE